MKTLVLSPCKDNTPFPPYFQDEGDRHRPVLTVIIRQRRQTLENILKNQLNINVALFLNNLADTISPCFGILIF